MKLNRVEHMYTQNQKDSPCSRIYKITLHYTVGNMPEESKSNHPDSKCFMCNAPASKKCPHCSDEVYYCCDAHFDYHRSKNFGELGEMQCNPFAIKFTDEVGR